MLFIAGQNDGSCDRDGDVRLFGGTSQLNGRVEVCYQKLWGTVCDDLWDDNDAAVICRQLGHSSLGKHQARATRRSMASFLPFFLSPAGARAIVGTNSDYQLATGPIYLDNVQCRGDEEFFVNCSSLGFLEHDCTHLEDAGVNCEGM